MVDATRDSCMMLGFYNPELMVAPHGGVINLDNDDDD